MEYLLYILLSNMTIDCILIWSEYLLLISIHTIQHLEHTHRHLMELYDYSLTRYIMEHMSHLDYCYCWQLLPYSDSPLNKYYLEWLLYICNIHIFRLSSDCNTLLHTYQSDYFHSRTLESICLMILYWMELYLEHTIHISDQVIL